MKRCLTDQEIESMVNDLNEAFNEYFANEEPEIENGFCIISGEVHNPKKDYLVKIPYEVQEIVKTVNFPNLKAFKDCIGAFNVYLSKSTLVYGRQFAIDTISRYFDMAEVVRCINSYNSEL